MRRRRATGHVAAAVAVLTISFAAPSTVAAQQPPPPQPTQPRQPTATQPVQTQPQSTATNASRVALGALGREAAALVALGAFGTDAARIEQAVGPVLERDADREASVDTLERADDAGSDALGPLVQATPTTSPDVRSVLARLSSADLDAASGGRAISIQSEVYLRALDHLARYGGAGPRTPAPPDPTVIANALASAPALQGNGDDDDSSVPIILVVALVAVVAVVGALLFRRRSTTAPAPPLPTTPVTPFREPLVTRPSAASMHDLLDVSRRLTAAASAGNVDRLIVRHALDLVRGDGAAVLRIDEAGGLHPSAESHTDLLVVEELSDSAIARVAETGQTLVQASASDRAIRNVPAAIAAVPLVGGGRVLAVLVVVRRVHEPFTADERTVLEALAPVAAAAMHTAMQSQAAVETSLVDALTRTGNRRRFDAELQRVLEDGDGPTSLIIVDLDHFKSVNDTYGHQAGDTVLQVVGSILREQIRPGDTVYRFGGEEFCVLLPTTEAAEAADVAERLRAAIEGTSFRLSDGERIERTASFGVASTASTDAADLIGRADAALYDAKQGGRNAVRVDGAPIS